MLRCFGLFKRPSASTIRLLRSRTVFAMSEKQVSHTNGDAERRKRPFHDSRKPKRRKIRNELEEGIVWPEGTNDEVLLKDAQALLAAQKLGGTPQEQIQQEDSKAVLERYTEIEVKVVELSSVGDGLAISPSYNQIFVVPFTVPGDKARIKVYDYYRDEPHALADLLEVIEPSPLRDTSRIKCQYFGKCAGCQFQMLDYAEQLKHKKSIVYKAFKNFSGLPAELIPPIQDTMGSPLQYGYRTKLTPHFDGPYLPHSARKRGIKIIMKEVPPIGFSSKGRGAVIDIEDCPLGTEVVRLGLKRERKRVAGELEKYARGATILLRESTKRIPKTDKEDTETADDIPSDAITTATESYTDVKTCITDNNATSTEYVDSYVFTNLAGSFFQNNNSILSPFTQYIRDVILAPSTTSTEAPNLNYLIDAYSGSGLFTITLSSLFKSSIGIDIDGPAIKFARQNATQNNVPPSQASFIAADADELFKSVKFPSGETVVVIDPPRKGCSRSFLFQLLKFAPKRVVYVSCNVHTQARDVGLLVNGKDGVRYEINSLRGFDFFPQTGHVEGVAVLDMVSDDTDKVLYVPLSA